MALRVGMEHPELFAGAISLGGTCPARGPCLSPDQRGPKLASDAVCFANRRQSTAKQAGDGRSTLVAQRRILAFAESLSRRG